MDFNRLKITKLADNAELGIVGEVDMNTGCMTKLHHLKLYSTKEVITQPFQWVMVYIGFSITIPDDYRGCLCLEEPFNYSFYLTDLGFTSNPSEVSMFEIKNCREKQIILPSKVCFATMSFHKVE